MVSFFSMGIRDREGDNRDADIVVINSCEYKPMALECPFPGDSSPLHRTRIMDLLASLHFSLSITGPICLVLVLGIWLKRLGLLPDSFVESASRLVFQVTLPALLFLSMVRTDFSTMPSPWLILYGLLGTLAGFLVLEVLAARFISEQKQRGIFVQGSFRGNMGIMGLAYVQNAYGPEGMGRRPAGGLHHSALQRARGDHPDPQPGGRKGSPILKGSSKTPHHRHSGGPALRSARHRTAPAGHHHGQLFRQHDPAAGPALHRRQPQPQGPARRRLLTGWATVNRLCCIPVLLVLGAWALGFSPAGPRHPVSHQLHPHRRRQL
jgi:hypothetical protein